MVQRAIYTSLVVTIVLLTMSLGQMMMYSYTIPSAAKTSDLPLCSGKAYREGEWVRSSTQWYPYFYGDQYTSQCDRSDRLSIWQLNSSEKSLFGAMPPPSYLLNSSQLYVRPALKYVWTPATCTLTLFPQTRPVEFCLSLHQRPLLFVGDSITLQQFQSLVYWLGDDLISSKVSARDGSRICQHLLDVHHSNLLNVRCAEEQESTTCKNWKQSRQFPLEFDSFSVRIRFIRNDHMSSVNETVGYKTAHGRQDVEEPWRNALTPDTILVLNSGVHVIDIELYRQHLQEVLLWLWNNYPLVTVIWRSSVPGHADCNNVLNQLPFTRARYEHFDRQDQLLHQGNVEYNWTAIRQLNAEASLVLESFRISRTCSTGSTCGSSINDEGIGFGGWYELDVDSFDRLRPDGHRPGDCLHQCLPGPIDTWNQLLYHFLLGNV